MKASAVPIKLEDMAGWLQRNKVRSSMELANAPAKDPILFLFKRRLTHQSLHQYYATEISSRYVKSISFQGRPFSVPKKRITERRVILILSELNMVIACHRFKMTIVYKVKGILSQRTQTSPIDLKDAYWHLPIRKNFLRLLGFMIKNKFSSKSYHSD